MIKPRVSLAFALFAAGFAALAGVHITDERLREIGKKRPTYRPKSAAFDFGLLQSIDRREFRNGGRYFGLMTRVAKELGVQPATVEYVSRGAAISHRILNAIVAEIRRVDSDPNASPLPLSSEEHAEFSRGGRYYGVSARVSKSLGMLNSNMHRALRGKTRSPRILAAVRTEMARVDAEIASKNGGGQA